MDDKQLARMAAALREATDSTSTAAQDGPAHDSTRERILADAARLHRGRAPLGALAQCRRWLRARWVLPLLLGCGASSALARVTYTFFPETWNALVPEVWARPQVEPVTARRRGKVGARVRPQPALAEPVLAEPVLAEPVLAEPVLAEPVLAEPVLAEPVLAEPARVEKAAPVPERPAAKVRQAPRDAGGRHRTAKLRPIPGEQSKHGTRRLAVRELPAPVKVVQNPKPAPEPKPALEQAVQPDLAAAAQTLQSSQAVGRSAGVILFRRAMVLHRAKDAQAIRAWQDFLRVAGRSPLVPEARYNLALALLRAEEIPEARAALAPFARGAYAGYRQREAQALLEQLGARGAAATSGE